VSDRVEVIWDQQFTEYDFGPQHPMRPLRLDLTIALARSLRLLDRDNLTVVAPRTADDDILALAHDPEYVSYVRGVGSLAPQDWLDRYGLGTPDNPVFERMHEASALAVGGTVDAARAVWSGRADHAVNIAGGLHHAMRDRAAGFCVYNDAVVGIAWLLANGCDRVAYVDVDAHHGDGVQAAFYSDPRVLTISLHESGRFLFPGTGWPYETGEGEGIGYAVNVALPPGTRDSHWLRAFHAVALPLIRAYRPSVLVTQHGADSHTLDPLTDLLLSVDGHRASYKALHRLAHEVTGGRWIALGGGGYETVQVVPRSWTQLIAIAAGRSLAGATPTAWRDYVHDRAGAKAPTMFTDRMSTEYRPWEGGEGDPASRIDQEINKTRQALFPLHGLDPDRSEY
jgi:acetoin utilization protein AcuC